MGEFLSFLKFGFGCGTVLFLVFMGLLALPASKLRYVGLECMKWVVAGVLLLMVPSPVDCVPDAVPAIGIVDDLGYVVGAICSAKSAIGDRRKRNLLEEAEFEDRLKRN